VILENEFTRVGCLLAVAAVLPLPPLDPSADTLCPGVCNLIRNVNVTSTKKNVVTVVLSAIYIYNIIYATCGCGDP